MLINPHSARPPPPSPLPHVPPVLWLGIHHWMRYARFDLDPTAFTHVSSQFGLYSFLEYEDNYGANFVSTATVLQTFRVLIEFRQFDSFNLDYSISHPEWISTPAPRAEEEILPTIPRVPAPSPEPTQRSAGKINLSSLHHRMMRSKGYVPDVSLDQLDGVVRKQILRQADRLMFDYQAQSDRKSVV